MNKLIFFRVQNKITQEGVRISRKKKDIKAFTNSKLNR